jgi:histidine kinase/DNA gyrase B/HSP90-like ATPase
LSSRVKMRLKLTLDRGFFAELTQRLWRNSSDVVRELVQNSFDGDSSRVIVTFLPRALVIEDDGGMDSTRIKSFLQVGGSHQDAEFTPSGRRVVGKYRVGRLSALGSFRRMQVRTRLHGYHVAFEFSVEDLERLAQGTVSIRDEGLPALRRNGTEISLLEPAVRMRFDQVKATLIQQPILRTPGFDVYLRQAQKFREWNLRGSERVLPKDIPGMKIRVRIRGPVEVNGFVTIAADSALPLAEEDRGIGIVSSSHLVSRSLFGFEDSPYRFDRLTGYLECNELKTTFGAKDRLVEDDSYRAFNEVMHRFLQRRVVPALRDVELLQVGKLELKTLRHIDRLLGEALVKVAGDLLPSQPLPPKALKALAPAVIRRTKESTVLVVSEKAVGRPALERPFTGGDGQKLGEIRRVEAPGRITQGRPGNGAAAGARRVGHYLHDVGIAVFIYEDAADDRPSYNDPGFAIEGVHIKAVFINKLHPSYLKCEKMGGLVNHLVTLIAHELVAISDRDNLPTVQLINKIYGTAMAR